MPFIDEATVKMKAGNGGDGCMSFLRAKYMPKGGPNGGDGGKGADLIIFCDENTTDLTAFAYTREWEAPNGERGMGSVCTGKEGKNLVLKVPLGTDIIDVLSGKKVAELLHHGQEVCLLKGGKGGLGNVHFKSSVNRAPRQFTLGRDGQKGEYRLSLRSIADVGLVGYPNAGKSSLINQLTRANSKVGAYPFTTMSPHLGLMEASAGGRITIADIPGLIEGASENKGLGHQFLKHIERCKLLLFVVDVCPYEDGRSPKGDYQALVAELKAYNPEMLAKAQIIVANKIDLIDKKLPKTLFGAAKGAPAVYPISCTTGVGIEELKAALGELLKVSKA